MLFEELLAEAEVSQFNGAIIEEDIGGLEVPVQNMRLVECLEGCPELLEDLQRLLLRQSSLPLDVLGKRASVAILINEIVVAGRAEHLNELDDIGVGDLGEDVDLIIGELGQLRSLFELVSAHYLHRIVQFCLFVLGAVDVAVLP